MQIGPKLTNYLSAIIWRYNFVNCYRAVARSENPGGLVVMGGDIVPTLVEIG